MSDVEQLREELTEQIEHLESRVRELEEEIKRLRESEIPERIGGMAW